MGQRATRAKVSPQEPTLAIQQKEAEVLQPSTDTAPPGFISPTNVTLLKWHLVMLFLIIYSAIATPLRVSFSIGLEKADPLTWVDLFVDFAFLIDICLQFRTGIVSKHDKSIVIYDWRSISWEYITHFFFIDLIACFPLDVLVLYPEANLTQLLKTVRLFKIAKLVKIIRLLRVQSIVSEINNNFFDFDGIVTQTTQRMISTLFWIFILTHFCTCLWYFSGTWSDDESWILHYERYAYDNDDKASLYLASMYWCVSTLTSVGYGDIVATSVPEQVCAVILTWIGSSVFTFVIGNMNSIIADWNRASTQFHSKMDSIHAYLRYRHVPKKLRGQILRHFRYYFARKTTFDEKEIMSELSHYLRVELSSFLTNQMISSIHIFEGLKDPSFMATILVLLKPLSCLPGDIIIREGEIATEMFLLVTGQVEVISSNGTVISILGKGSHFGEISSLDSKVERRATNVRAISHCDMFTLSKEDLIKVTEDFPDIQERIEQMTIKREKIALNLKGKKKLQKDMISDVANVPDNLTGSYSSKNLSADRRRISRSKSLDNLIEPEPKFAVRRFGSSSNRSITRQDSLNSAGIRRFGSSSGRSVTRQDSLDSSSMKFFNPIPILTRQESLNRISKVEILQEIETKGLTNSRKPGLPEGNSDEFSIPSTDSTMELVQKLVSVIDRQEEKILKLETYIRNKVANAT